MFSLFIFLVFNNFIVYNPSVDSMISSVDSANLVKWNREASGEDSIFYLGDSTLILTRYYDTFGNSKSEDYLFNYFENLGLEVYKEVFWLKGGFEGRYSYDYYKWSGNYNGYSVVNDSIFYLTSSDSVLFYSNNGGYRWYRLKEFPYIINGVSSPVPGTLYIYSSSGELFFSSDWGNSYEKRDSMLPSNIQDICFINGKKGWAVSNFGVVGRTEDAGITWDTTNLKIPVVRDIFFADSLNGWICAFLGKIYHTDDGGITWNQQSSPVANHLFSVFFMSADTGWICGDNGTVLRTFNGGDNWEDFSFSGEKFRSIIFNELNEGWLSGDNCPVYYSSDGGENWIIDNDENNSIECIQISENIIYFIGAREFLIKEGSNYNSMRAYLPNAVCNIVAVQEGSSQPDTVVVIGGHFDSITMDDSLNYIRAPGANDNATGFNTIRETARILSEYNFDYTIEYILYNAEEIGLVGSEYNADYAAAINKPIKGVINLDCLGFDIIGTHDIEIITDPEGAEFARIALDVISIYSLPLNPVYVDTNTTFVPSDLTSFILNGYSGVNFWNHEFGPINTVHDSIHIVNPSMHYNMTKLTVGQLAYMAGLAGSGLPEHIITYGVFIKAPDLINSSYFSFTAGIHGKTNVRIGIYDVTGRLIHNVYRGELYKSYKFTVNKKLDSGVYFIRLESDKGNATVKLLVL